MKATPIIIAILAVAALVFFQWKGCQQSKADMARAVAAEASEQRASAKFDSAARNADSAFAGWRRDTLRFKAREATLIAAFTGANHLVDQEKKTIAGMVDKYDAAKAAHDTATQLQECDSIRYQLREARGAVSDLQTSAETLTSAFGTEVQQRDSTISVLAGNFVNMRTAKDSLAAISIEQARANIRLAKQASKRWSLGIGAGAVLTTGGIAPGITVSIHYTLIRI